MNKQVDIASPCFPLAAFLISCFFLCSCENSQGVIDEWTKDKVMTEEATGVESLLSQEGKVKAKLKAPLMIRVMTDTQYVEFPKTLHVDFYDDSVRVETWLDCHYGKYYEMLDKVYLRDSVVVITTKGDTLRCPDLWWDQRKALFYTDKYSTYHSKNEQLIHGGKGLEATQDLKRVTFKVPTGIVDMQNSGI